MNLLMLAHNMSNLVSFTWSGGK